MYIAMLLGGVLAVVRASPSRPFASALSSKTDALMCRWGSGCHFCCCAVGAAGASEAS